MKNLAPTFTANLNPFVGIPNKFETPTALATEILGDIMQFRRAVSSDATCTPSSCGPCFAPHLPKVVSAILQRKPIMFVLPAFPGKSPNPKKVLGPLPDMAERRALEFLNCLGNRVKRLYEPGARIILCSDGRVFSDIVGMREEDVTAYQREIDQIIEELSLENISTFNLDELKELGAQKDFVQMREALMKRHAQPLESLKEKVSLGGETQRMYCGITRFLFEDSIHPGQTKSRTSIQKDCRVRAYQVLQRSNAWSELIAERFPDAVRLSIHPQSCGAPKLGIQLLGTDSWMTPWHGVAVDTGTGFVLVKRWEAEKLAAELVRDWQGRASHYKLGQQNGN